MTGWQVMNDGIHEINMSGHTCHLTEHIIPKTLFLRTVLMQRESSTRLPKHITIHHSILQW